MVIFADRSRWLSWFLALWLLGGWLGSVEATPRIETWNTAAGSRVMFVASPELPMVDVRLVFDAGSARDGERSGLAVLTNSVLTEGAGGLSADEIAERMDRIGADLGSGAERDYAWFSLRTLSEAKVLTAALETYSLILAKPDFPPKDLERQRQAMQVNLRTDEQSPGSVAQKAFYRNLYADHPYAQDSGGTQESLKAITRAEVEAFYRKYYVAPNALVAIVGALTRPQAEQLAEQITSGLPKGQRAAPLPEVKSLAGALEKKLIFPSTQSHIFIGQPGIKRNDPDFFSLYVGNHILGGSGLVSILVDEVREKRGLSYSVYSYFLPMLQAGPFLMGAQTKNASVDEALGLMNATLKRFIREGPTAEELTAAKKNITGGFPLRISNNSKILEYLAVIGFYNMPLDYLDTFNAKIEAVTAEQIRDALRRRLNPEQMVTVVVGGEPKTRSP